MKQNIVEAKRVAGYARLYIIALMVLCFSSSLIFSHHIFLLLLPMMCLNIISNYWLSYKIEESLKVCKKAEEELAA